MSFTHPGHPTDRDTDHRLGGKVLTNKLNEKLRADMNVDPRLNGAPTGELNNSHGSKDDPRNQEWVFWHRDHEN